MSSNENPASPSLASQQEEDNWDADTVMSDASQAETVTDEPTIAWTGKLFLSFKPTLERIGTHTTYYPKITIHPILPDDAATLDSIAKFVVRCESITDQGILGTGDVDAKFSKQIKSEFRTFTNTDEGSSLRGITIRRARGDQESRLNFYASYDPLGSAKDRDFEARLAAERHRTEMEGLESSEEED